MNTLYYLLMLAGVAHFGILTASALSPRVCCWDFQLRKLPNFFETLFWIYGLFIILVVVGFGTLTLKFASDMADGTGLARGLAAFIAMFWGVRLFVQVFVFDESQILETPRLRYGYRVLTCTFAALVGVYGWAAVIPR